MLKAFFTAAALAVALAAFLTSGPGQDCLLQVACWRWKLRPQADTVDMRHRLKKLKAPFLELPLLTAYIARNTRLVELNLAYNEADDAFAVAVSQGIRRRVDRSGRTAKSP